ncbi:MAG: hypothetical protein AAGA92_11700 [Planctomycetota bacterium]
MRRLYVCVVLAVAAAAHAQPLPPEGDQTPLSPTTAAVMELPRDTPSARMIVLAALIDLDEKELAATEFQALDGLGLGDEAKADLALEFGTARMLQVARLEGAAEGAREFALSCLAAANARLTSPERLQELVGQLASDSAFDRRAAVADLAATGTDGAVKCFETLAATEDEQTRAYLLAALIELHPASDEPLLTLLYNSEGRLLSDCAELAGELRLGAAAPALVAALQDDQAAQAAAVALQKTGSRTAGSPAAMLRGELDKLSQQLFPAAAEASPAEPETEALVTTWWLWDPETSMFAPMETSRQNLPVLRAARVGHALLREPGASDADRRRALVFAIAEAEILGRGLSAETKAAVDDLPSDRLSAALGQAIDHGLVVPVERLAAMLADRGDASVLMSAGLGLGGTTVSPLVSGVLAADDRIRWACLETVMRLGPQERFAGESYVPKALVGFVETALPVPGVPQAPTDQAAQALDWLAGLLGDAGPYDELPRYARVAERSVYVLGLTEPSIRVLAAAGTGPSQRTLLEYASSAAGDVGLRAAAAEAFERSVEQFGKRITGADILRQYERYNASGAGRKEEQERLGRILDVLEEK